MCQTIARLNQHNVRNVTVRPRTLFFYLKPSSFKKWQFVSNIYLRVCLR